MASSCKECGCMCSKCTLDHEHDIHLHAEIEALKQKLIEKHNHIVTMETNFLNEANKYPNGELLALHEELLTWQDKYKRLYDAHRRVQRVNQGLEDKLLRLVDITETDKSTLTKDVATLSHKLAEANYAIKKLTLDNERYKNDVSLAIQFLQCKPGNFVSQKFDTLPNEVQAKVSTYMGLGGTKRKTEEKKPLKEMKSIKVPIPTFPPTAMVYSVPKTQQHHQQREEREPESPVDIVSAAIMAKVLEERERERSCIKHCDTCTCSNQIKIIHDITHHSIATQTAGPHSEDSLCLQCNNKLDRPMTILKKGVSQVAVTLDQCKYKPVPVYVHDYKDYVNEGTTTGALGCLNVAKVQPNNFLIDTKLRKENMNSMNKLGSRITPATALDKSPNLLESDDLIDFSSTSSTSNNHVNTNTNTNEMIYFANEKAHKKGAFKIKTHEVRTAVTMATPLQLIQPLQTHHKLCQQSKLVPDLKQSHRNILLDSSTTTTATSELQQVFLPREIVRRASSLSSGEYGSEMTTSTNHQRVEEWIESTSSSNMTTTAIVESNCATDCSESLISSSHNERKDMTEVHEQEHEHEISDFKIDFKKQYAAQAHTGDLLLDIAVDLEKSKYKEMEDHVKKFLFGEYTILSEVKKEE